MILPASYSNGFAPRDGQPLYPELWRGCVGSWAPCLGPSGLVLRDVVRSNHGTLTNMDAGSDWVASGGRYALDFDGTNDHIAMADLGATTQWTVAAWMMLRATGNYMQPVCIKFGSVGSNGIATRLGTIAGIRADAVGTSGGIPGGFTYALNTWYHVAVNWNGTTGICVVNGIQATFGVADSGWGVTGTKIGDGYSTHKTNGQIDDVMVYNRVLTINEIRLLASRRGIAYELAPRRRSSIQVPATSGFSVLKPTIIRVSA